MLTISLSDEMSSRPIARGEGVLWGGTVFFEVDDMIFEVPRNRFTENSEVFADMFHIPQAEDGEDVEGRHRDRPIVLEGYKAADFTALVKVLCPTLDDVIEGTWNLPKEDWIGVLNLSKRWGMKKIRKYAIAKLSDMSLRPVEKVVLAREHEVPQWLKEGLNEIVCKHPIHPLAELKSRLGADTACTLVWIQNQALSTSPTPSLVLSLGLLGCSNCPGAMFQTNRDCYNCSRIISVDDRNSLYLAGGSSTIGMVTSVPASPAAPATMNITINLEYLRCRACSNRVISRGSYSCPSCSRNTEYHNFRLRPALGVVDSICASRKILEEFGDEISRYELWDQ